ncbi:MULTISPECIES: bifunctional 4-hydroxy-2-oxoglutarate aldolase/2-dehydro-3-deoxy-phosphogluconate aldolase [Pseudoalteromonas]|uniref:bifunctional 4-hydroxy-2-oxoglutarate aldolase/2-dehydro-3-deoxy-phosphogluconate aldolase n=1 Tax=Pseudoalteromonas TaxID=53246 RepID=UPI00023160E4|nr:bifunctional 4-hydroxy-2-oxoglutarate aldolase/2-dehydro-3-deoxy-phosphogluconate aldolase [Pseudoalteromonas sp. BSi20495]GAA78405.1 2-dehydro-3-deoxyphosphogluconate aldolase / 4-hydroxy-2-oxoglutarate aldolase [Pseudoalteromonas sp. BSi20495]
MSNKPFSALMASQPILPIIQANDEQQGIDIANAMYESGIHLVEVVLRTEQSINALKAIKHAIPNLIVGAGTVTSTHILDKALNAGADYIVTPAVSSKLLDALSSCEVPCLPGVSNTSDILLATEFGFNEQKLFPASLAGGQPFLKAVSSVFKDVRFCPTGGINQDNYQEYLALSNVFAVGGTWVANPQWVINKQWQLITQACLQVLEAK